MPFRLQAAKPLPSQVKSVFRERIQLAAAEVAAYGPDAPGGIHAARKNIKRCRALLRLLRRRGLKRVRRGFNTRLRDIARSLSHNRDREVLIALLDSWADPAANAFLARACRRLQSALLREDQPVADLDPAVRAAACAQLERVAADFSKARLAGLKSADLRRAAERAYRRLRGGFIGYKANPGVDEFHELRKAAKDHFYHRQLLADVLALKPSRTRAIRSFEGLLGKARDCDLLLVTIDATHLHGLHPRQVASLRRKAAAEKAALLAGALQLGDRLLRLDQSAALAK